MSRVDLEQSVVRILRERALDGSTRDLDLDAPLGESGVGLDSLGMVQFLSGLESEFKIRVPVEFWARADQASLNQCIDLVRTATEVI